MEDISNSSLAFINVLQPVTRHNLNNLLNAVFQFLSHAFDFRFISNKNSAVNLNLSSESSVKQLFFTEIIWYEGNFLLYSANIS